MNITISEYKHSEYIVNFNYPFYRRLYESDDTTIYWKFESQSKATRVKECMSEISILHYNDPSVNFVYDMITSKAMLLGHPPYDVINEQVWDRLIKRVIDTVASM